MNLTYGKIKNAFPALTKLSKLDLKAVEAVKLARLLEKVETELKPLEETQRNLWIKYGEEIKNGEYKIMLELEQKVQYLENKILELSEKGV